MVKFAILSTSAFEVAAGAGEDEIAQKALASPGVQRHIEGKQVVKTIYAAGKLLSIVTK